MIVGAMPQSTLKPSGLSKRSIYELAEKVAGQLGYPAGGDLIEVVRKLGGRVEYRNYWNLDDDSGSLDVDRDGKFRIYVPADTGPARDKFTIAHELGHYVLHYLWMKKHGHSFDEGLKASRYGSDRAEWEANWFAAAFLMPASEFRAAALRLNRDYAELGRRFGVSASAAQVRCRALNI